MPTLPTYGGPHIAAAPLPDVRLSPSTPGGAFETAAPNLAAPANALETIARTAKVHADQVATLDADNRLAAAQDAILYDPQKGALTQRGKNAFGTPETASTAWQSGVSDVINSLTNDDQKRAVQQLAAQRGQQIHELVTRHVAGEMATYDADQTKASIENTTNDAVTNLGNPQALGFAMAKQHAVATDYATRAGLSPEASQAFIAGTLSGTHAAIIKRLLSEGDDQAAQQYYAAHADAIVGTDKGPIESALATGATLGSAQRLSDAITADPSLSLSDARQKVKDLATEPEVRRQAMDLVEHEYAVREQKASDTERAVSAQFATTLEQSGGDIGRLIREHGDLWNAQPESLRSAMRGYAMHLASGEAVQTDPATYYGLVKLAGDPAQRDKWINKTNLLAYADALSRSDLQSLMRLQADSKAGTAPSDPGILSRYDRATQTLKAAGIDPDSKNTDQRKDVASYLLQVDNGVRALETSTGRKASDADVQQIADDLLIRARVDGTHTWFGFGGPTTKPLYQFQPDEHPVADVPDADRQQITDAYQTRFHRAPSEGEIMAQYQRMHATRGRGPTP